MNKEEIQKQIEANYQQLGQLVYQKEVCETAINRLSAEQCQLLIDLNNAQQGVIKRV